MSEAKHTHDGHKPAPMSAQPQPIPAQPGRRHLGGFQHRREVLGALAAAPVAAATPALAAPEDPHLAWERDVIARKAHMEAVSGELDDDEFDQLNGDCWDVVEQICSTPARTLAGIATQIRVVVTGIGQTDDPNGVEREGLRNAVRSLELLAGRA